MEEGAKRRLVGAAVIVVLLVIFLPMLLEEEETMRPVSEQDMSIPPRPDFDQGYDTSVWEDPVEPPKSSGFREHEEPTRGELPLELPPPTFIDAPATTEPELTPESAPLPTAEAPPAAEPTPPPKQQTPPAAKPTSPPKQQTPPAAKPTSPPKQQTPPASKPTPTSKPAPKPKPAPAAPTVQASATPSSWVIQVTSLQERERAYAIVQELRAKGFPAYLQEAQVNQKLWHRVRIGPELGRERIESMAADLRRKTGMKGQIQRYP